MGKIKKNNFYKWAYSDLLTNTQRGILAEYIVATALNIDNKPRIEWDEYDLDYNGLRVEVKSCAYIQAWEQKKHSSIRFAIGEKIKWDKSKRVEGKPAENKRTEIRERNNDLYVFCLFDHKDRETADPTNLNQWTFYIAPTKLLNKKLGNQKSLSLSTLDSLGIKRTYSKYIKKIVDNMNEKGDL